MRKKARNTIEKFHMFPRQAHIVVGLSGGADSVALLHVLSSLKEEFRWKITAVHIHHGLRGEEADQDAAFAEEFCKKLDISCIVRKFDVKAEAKARKLGEEETGRILRYEAFREVAGKNGFIAVAHHRQDHSADAPVPRHGSDGAGGDVPCKRKHLQTSSVLRPCGNRTVL